MNNFFEGFKKSELVKIQERGWFAWLMQRLTAVFLLLFLGTHIYLLHFLDVSEEISVTSVMQRLSSPFVVFVDLGLLAVVLFHALNGFRAVVFDFGLPKSLRRIFTWLLVLVGIFFFIFGMNGLFPFLGIKPLFYWL